MVAESSRVLVTSRRQTWNPALGVDMWNLELLDRHESIKLLRTLAAHLTDDQAGPIAEELGDLPLALHMAGSYLHCYDDEVHPSAFLRQLQDKALLEHDSLQGRGTKFSPTKHDLHVAKTFALSYDRLDPQDDVDRIALALLARAACFAPGIPIPKALLFKTLDRENNTIDPLDMKDGLSRILDVGLIESEAKGALVLHRLLAAYVKNVSVMDAKAQSDFETALLDEANRVNNSGIPGGLIVWQPHLRFVTDQAMEREDETGAGLCNTLGYHLKSIGDYKGARPYYKKALEIYRKVLGDEHPDTAGSLNHLGYLLDVMGDYEAARPYYEKALEIRRKVLGDEHPDTAGSLNNLGFLLDAKGDYEGARPYYEKALEIRKKVLGEEHPDTAQSLNNLGALLQTMGDYEGARPYYEKALEIRRKVFGEEHPDTAQSLNNLAILYYYENDLKEAANLMQQALAIQKKVLGKEHPDTRSSMESLAVIEEAF